MINEDLANRAASFLPATNDDELPALRLPHPDGGGGSVLVFAYWKNGTLFVTLDDEDRNEPVPFEMRLAETVIARGGMSVARP
jgi:hypothetical protein